MLEHLRLEAAATAINKAVAALLAAAGPRSPDLGGSATTSEIGDAIVERIKTAPLSRPQSSGG
jgi:tartrate dehydrogenase/decarboxylase/D-malate dehydrogenase